MSWEESPGPNTNIKFHLFLLAIAWFNWEFGIFLLSIPLLAWVLSRWIVMALEATKRKAEEDAVGDWNGRYYAYDDRQVRVHWDEEGTWVDADDVFRLLARKPDAVAREKIRRRLGRHRLCVPGGLERECFSAAGVLEYLGDQPDLAAQKARRWFEREVFANISRLRERNADHYHRYRLDRES